MLNRLFSFLQLCHSALWGVMSCCLVSLGGVDLFTIAPLLNPLPSGWVVGCLSLAIAEIPATICAYVALKKGYQLQAKAIRPGEIGFAQAGLVLGYISLTFVLLFVLLIVLLMFWATLWSAKRGA